MRGLGVDGLCWLLAISGGIVAGATDFVAHIQCGEDVWPAMPLAAFGGAILALLQPRRAWRWAVAGSLAVFASHLIGAAITGHRPADPPSPSVWAPLVIIVPATIGVLGGVALRRVASALSPRPDHP